MTAQIPDGYYYKGEEYKIVALEKEWPFDISSLGVEPVPPHTGCWNGYSCEYSIGNDELLLMNLHLCLKGEYPEINGVKPEKEAPGDYIHINMRLYREVNIPIKYSGGMIIARDFNRDYYIHMGYQKPYGYRVVYELIFEEGKLINSINHSEAMENLREKMAKQKNGNDKQTLMEYIDTAFSLKYEDKWF